MSLLYLTSVDVIVVLDLFDVPRCLVVVVVVAVVLFLLLVVVGLVCNLPSDDDVVILNLMLYSEFSMLILNLPCRVTRVVDAVDNVEKGSLTPVLTKQVPVADPGVGTRLLKGHCHESMLSMSLTMAMSMNTMLMMNSLSNFVLDEVLSNYLLNRQCCR